MEEIKTMKISSLLNRAKGKQFPVDRVVEYVQDSIAVFFIGRFVVLVKMFSTANVYTSWATVKRGWLLTSPNSIDPEMTSICGL